MYRCANATKEAEGINGLHWLGCKSIVASNYEATKRWRRA
jgi:hypothetical protein